MNSDSFFDSDLIQENKAIITILTTVSLAFFTIYWLYRGLKPEENLRMQTSNNQNFENNLNNIANNNINQTNIMNGQTGLINIPKLNNKRRLLINATNLLIENSQNIDIGKIYQFLHPLSEIFDLYMVIMIKENNEVEKIYEKFEILTNDNIIYKHVRYFF